MTLLSAVVGKGTLASRPAAGMEGRLYFATDSGGGQWTRDTGTAWEVTDGGGGGSSGLYTAYLLYQDQKASGTGGGTFTSGAYRTRDINTEVVDTGGNGSVTSNQITLATGTYDTIISCPAYAVNYHQARLRNITAGTTLLSGSSEYSSTTGNAQTSSIIMGRFTLSVSSVLEVQHQGGSTQATLGFGVAAGAGFTVANETYVSAAFYKV